MKTTKTLIAIAALVAGGAAFAQATTTTPLTPEQQVLQRQANQQQRVDNGIQSGALTTHEARQLQKKEAGVDKVIARDAKDGISAKEQKRINTRQDAVSRDIARDTHNARRSDSTPAQRAKARHARKVHKNHANG